jgi:hypothetical protein
MMEGAVDLQSGANDLRDLGVDKRTRKVVSTALATLPTSMVKARSIGPALPGL